MSKKTILVLEDGSIYEGYSFGAETEAHGEVVFSTSMTGYQEMLTDPSYAGQILVPTYPLIGNYGINPEDFESKRIQLSGFVVRENCPLPSHWQSTKTLHQFLAESGVPGIYGVDTRAITRHLRSVGVMMGLLTSSESPNEALTRLKSMRRYNNTDFVKGVSTKNAYQWQASSASDNTPRYHIVVVDCGLKLNILRILSQMGCAVTVVPCTASVDGIMNLPILVGLKEQLQKLYMKLHQKPVLRNQLNSTKKQLKLNRMKFVTIYG